MKTTVDIADGLFQQAKKYAEKHGLTFREVVESGLRDLIAKPVQPGTFKLQKAHFKGEGQLVTGWEEIRDILYEGRGA